MKYFKNLFAIVIIFSLLSCSEDYLVEDPPHLLAPDNLYVDVTGFEAGLNGLYSQFSGEREGYKYGNSNDLRIDPATTGTDNMYGNERSGWARGGNDLDKRNTSTDSRVRELFNWIYRTINAANTIINRAENPEIKWSEEDKNRVIGEAKLFRAWAYRHASYLWGDVPLTLKESSGESIITNWTRTPISDVRAQMLEDLLFAETYLPTTPPSNGKVAKGVATHYLAELYLALGDYTNAKAKSESLINSGVYSLITSRYGVNKNNPGTPFTDMFLDGNSNRSEGNTEALWVMQHELDVNGGGYNIMRRWHRGRSQDIKVKGKSGHILITVENGGRGLERVSPTRYAMELYEDGDDRGGRFAWRDYEVLNNTSKTPPSGWKVGDTLFFNWKGKNEKEKNNYWPSTRKWDYANPTDLAGSRSYNDQIYLRLAETYLILAEAQHKLGDNAGAATTINIIRQRSNANDINASDIDIDFILDERSRELYSEEHRKYTLVRLGKWYERFQMYNNVGKSKGSSYHNLLAIPQTVIDANSEPMPQNPGYN